MFDIRLVGFLKLPECEARKEKKDKNDQADYHPKDAKPQGMKK